MSVAIRPTTADDPPALSRFLTAGFQTSADAEFAAVDVLRWKYLEPRGDGAQAPPRSLVAVDDDSGAIVGHVGFVPTAFLAPTGDVPVTALHMIDWLGSPNHRSVGASLMRKAHEAAPVQIGLGGSQSGRAVIRRGGYQPMPAVGVFERVLRPLSLLRAGGLSPKAAARAVRDLVRRRRRPATPAAIRLVFDPVPAFGPEILDVVAGASRSWVVAARTPERLNALLRHPRRSASAYLIREPDGRLRGFAVLTTLPRGAGRPTLGRVVDLLLDDAPPEAWHAALLGASSILASLGADVAQVFAPPAPADDALRRAGFIHRHDLDFHVRDRDALLPREAPWYVTPIEADYAFD